jgi:hypothetical protein
MAQTKYSTEAQSKKVNLKNAQRDIENSKHNKQVMKDDQTKHHPPDQVRIAFGSCNNQNLTNNLWEVITKREPIAFVWGGDVIYAGKNKQVTRLKVAPAASVPFGSCSHANRLLLLKRTYMSKGCK